jgi:hypothetical protein
MLGSPVDIAIIAGVILIVFGPRMPDDPRQIGLLDKLNSSEFHLARVEFRLYEISC